MPIFRVHDWLTGVRIVDIDEPGVIAAASNALTESERLRLVHDIITGTVEDGGATIVPGHDAYVESILPLHDQQFDKVSRAVLECVEIMAWRLRLITICYVP